MKPFLPTSPYPRGLGIALVLAAVFLILTLDVAHVVALGYGGAIAVGHVSRARWRI